MGVVSMASIFHLVPESGRPASLHPETSLPSSGGRHIQIVNNRGARRNCRGVPEPSVRVAGNAIKPIWHLIRGGRRRKRLSKNYVFCMPLIRKSSQLFFS